MKTKIKWWLLRLEVKFGILADKVLWMIVKSLEQFLCDFFLEGDLVEIEAKFLQSKLIELIKNERLALSQMRNYKMKCERAMLKIEALECSKLLQDISSNVKYRINERV